MTGRCQCPEFAHEAGQGDNRFCECPAHSQYDAAAKTCKCASGMTLTHKGCVIPRHDECEKRPMSWYDEGDNSCVTSNTAQVILETVKNVREDSPTLPQLLLLTKEQDVLSVLMNIR